MKYQIHQILPAIVTGLLFLVWEVPANYSEVVFFLCFSWVIFLYLVDGLFTGTLISSSRVKAIDLIGRFSKDVRLKCLRSIYRTGVVLGFVVWYLDISILYIYASLAYLYTSTIYFAHLGRTYADDMENPQDFVD